jgi:hypothetical protein
MTILFTSTAQPVGDFQVEKFYEENKNKRVIRIQNELVLHRFRLGVVQKEIQPFKLVTQYENGKIFMCERCDSNGNFCKSWAFKPFDKMMDIIMELM